MRRVSAGSKRAEGWEWQAEGRRVRRPAAKAIRMGASDPSLSNCGGLAAFNAFTQEIGLGRMLRERFGPLKTGRGVVYSMSSQLQLLIDAAVVGANRIFDIEALAGDAVFRHLAGGAVPSIDTLYDDLRRFQPEDLDALERMVTDQALESVRGAKHRELTVDIDTTVEPVFGTQEGAALGYNPRFRGRLSYHPILARIAETDMVLGARLRRGDTTLGQMDVEDIEQWITLLHEAAPDAIVTARIDSGGESAAVMGAVDRSKAYFVVKARLTQNLVAAVLWKAGEWRTVECDAEGAPTRQVAVLDFQRPDWPAGKYRAIAMRTNERDTGKQVCLWDELEHAVSVYITNDLERDPNELAWLYDGRAGIEPLIAELKNGFAIGKIPTSSFDANEAGFLIKVLAHNLLRRWVRTKLPAVSSWRASWVRRTCICVPARLLHSGRRWTLRLAPRPLLN